MAVVVWGLLMDYSVAIVITLIILYLMKKANQMLTDEEEDTAIIKGAYVVSLGVLVAYSVLALVSLIIVLELSNNFTEKRRELQKKYP